MTQNQSVSFQDETKRNETNRIHYTCIRLNENEKNLIDQYMKENNVKKRSTFIRDSIVKYLEFKMCEG